MGIMLVHKKHIKPCLILYTNFEARGPAVSIFLPAVESLELGHFMEVLFLVEVVPLLLKLCPNVLEDGGREVDRKRDGDRQGEEE